MTDEDKMIYYLTTHRNFIGWVVEKLKEEGISAKRTIGNDKNGDILLINLHDVPRAQALIRQIQSKYNS